MEFRVLTNRGDFCTRSGSVRLSRTHVVCRSARVAAGNSSVIPSFSNCIVHPAIVEVFYYQLMRKRNVLKSIKIYIKITLAATYFGVITIIKERTV